jgi:ABC-type glycerol-3-phosphate transport system substrate-binding protein
VASITRRSLLQGSAAATLAARAGGVAAILASGQAPAFAQATTVHWLRPANPLLASDQLLKDKIVPECQKALGIKLALEIIPRAEIGARIAAALATLAGPEIILGRDDTPRIHRDDTADVGDVAEQLGKVQGGYYRVASAVAEAGGSWIGVPWSIISSLIAYRKSWFGEIGYERFPETWEELRQAGRQLKAKGRPIGQALGHAARQAACFWYPLLWSWGGKEVEEDDKTVVLDTQATRASVGFAAGFWHEACAEDGLDWDASNSRSAFLSGAICATTATALLYLEAKGKSDKYKTENGTPLFQDIAYAAPPKGEAGQFNLPAVFTDMLMDYSPDPKPAKDFLRWVSSKPVFEQWLVSQQGLSNGPTQVFAGESLWKADPALLPFRDAPKAARLAGYAGLPGRAAAAARSKHIILDMYAKAVQGMPAAAAVAWAQRELVKIYD